MILQDLSDKIINIDLGNTYLYFVTRSLKPDLKKATKAMDKFIYKIYQIDVNDEIRTHLYDLTISQLAYLDKSKTELHEYEVITDDSEQLFTYSMVNKATAFSDILNNQLKNNPPKIKSLEEIILEEELWAYCVGFNFTGNEWIYTFRKLLSSKVAISEKDGNKHSGIQKTLRTIFNSKSEKLELIEGETVNLDKQIDCVFYEDVFYIAKKQQFEQIIGLEEEFKTLATQVVDQLKATDMIDGLDLIVKQIDANPSIHKKLVRLSKIGNYNKLDKNTIEEMGKVCLAREGRSLKIENDRLVLENEKDIDLLLRMLCDYYKIGEISGKPYGTFAGRELAVLTQ